jgi:hypothetical protein
MCAQLLLLVPGRPPAHDRLAVIIRLRVDRSINHSHCVGFSQARAFNRGRVGCSAPLTSTASSESICSRGQFRVAAVSGQKCEESISATAVSGQKRSHFHAGGDGRKMMAHISGNRATSSAARSCAAIATDNHENCVETRSTCLKLPPGRVALRRTRNAINSQRERWSDDLAFFASWSRLSPR